MNDGPRNMPRTWALQTAVLACAAMLLFWLFYAFDILAFFDGRADAPGVVDDYFRFDPVFVGNAVASLAGLNVAVFGIVITVVSIIVQLSADRYTGVTRMFVRDRVNTFVIGYYVVACVASVWLSVSLKAAFVPTTTLVAMLSLTSGGLVVMAPYFGYVFWFLEPQDILERIGRDAVKHAASGATASDEAALPMAQEQTLFALEELTDIAANSIAGKDKIIASAAVDALKDLALSYMALKAHANPAWFNVSPGVRLNPDFVAMDEQSLADLEQRRTWVEWQVMRQYLSIYQEALATMRDVNYLIAIDTRYIGEAAAKAGDAELIALVYRFMNSYLRATLNAKDVRTTYNVLNQYRKLVETMLEQGCHKAALDGVRHMKYYGLVGFDLNLNFVTETVAYDLATISEVAHQLGAPVETDILKEFLELDRPPFVREREKALMGVRKAQVKLAAYYIASGEEARARLIAADMRAEPAERLALVKWQLQQTESKDFWEIIDRGCNLEYLPPHHRECLNTFFGWLDIGDSQAKHGATE